MNKFETEVRELFPTLDEYWEYEKTGDVHIRIEGGFNAEALFKLSDLLGTSTIRTYPENGSEGCDTCGYGSTIFVNMDATNVKLND